MATGALGQTGKRASRPPVRHEPYNFLPDTTVLARVNDRAITAREFVDTYFNSYAEQRPRSDSAGRVQFLQTMIDKEVIARVARAAGRPESFEDRGAMRLHTQRVLANVLYRRAVVDSIQVTEADGQAIYAQMKRELRLQRLQISSRHTVESVRADLVAKRMSWERALERARLSGDTSRTDIGWLSRLEINSEIAPLVFGFPVGGISPLVYEQGKYSLYRVAAERPWKKVPSYDVFRNAIMDEVRSRQSIERSGRLLARLRGEIDMKYDTLNIAWAASRFPAKYRGSQTAHIVIDITVPEIAPEDTSRVLARFRGGQVTVGRLLGDFMATNEFQRPSLETEGAVRRQVDVIVLEPRMSEVARERGLGRDPLAVKLIEGRREEIMVDHLYQDSVMSHVFVSPAERRKYYRENEHRFVTPPNARYAQFYMGSRDSADTMVAQLRRGIRAEDILRADSIAGYPRGRIESRRQDQLDLPFHHRLFKEMREGQVITVGPDDTGGYNVVQLLALDSGRKVPFGEADSQIDEHLQQEMANDLLAAFTERHRRHMRIEVHPELVMRVRFVDPTL